MINFKEYLLNNAKKYDFRIKLAGQLDESTVEKMKALLSKFQCSHFKKLSETPIQELPLDFPKIKNVQVHIYEVFLDYPTTQWELHEYLSSNLGIIKNSMVVRRPGEPLEQYQHEDLTHEEPLLTDSTYKEAPNVKFEDYYGDSYNKDFLNRISEIASAERATRRKTKKTPVSLTSKKG